MTPPPNRTPGAGRMPCPDLAGVARGTMALIIASVLATQFSTLADWRGYLAGNGPDVDAAAGFADVTEAFATSALAAAGAAVLVWLWRARRNAEHLGGAGSQRRHRAWTIGAWFTPVVMLWFPYQIVADAWRASAPGPAGLARVRWWWATLLGNVVITLGILAVMVQDPTSDRTMRTTALLSTVAGGLDIAAGWLLVTIIGRITGWQEAGQRAAQRAELQTSRPGVW